MRGHLAELSSEENEIMKSYAGWKSEGTGNPTPTPTNPPATQTTDTGPSGEITVGENEFYYSQTMSTNKFYV